MILILAQRKINMEEDKKRQEKRKSDAKLEHIRRANMTEDELK